MSDTTNRRMFLLQLRTCSKFNIHCLEHPLYPGENQRPRQNSVFVGSSVSLLPNDRDAPRRAKSAFDLQSLVHAECTVQSTMDEQQDTIEMEPEFLSCTLRGQSLTNNGRLKPFNEYPKASRSFQRERGASICHFDRTDVLARPLQRERGMSICQFDRMDVLARPLQRDRGMSICHFDRMDVLAHPTHFRGSRASIASNVEKLENLTKSSLQRDSRVSMSFNHASIDKPACPENFHRFTGFSVQRDCRPNVATHLEKAESVARFLQRDSRSSLGNNERGMIIENLEAGKNGTNGQSVGSIGCSSKDRGSLVSPHDRPSCSKTPDVVLGYKATCV